MGFPKFLHCQCPYTNKEEDIQIDVLPSFEVRIIKGTEFCSRCPKLKPHKGSLYRFTGYSFMCYDGISQEVTVFSGRLLRLKSCRVCTPKDIIFHDMVVWEVWADVQINKETTLNIPIYQKTYPYLENLIAECNNVVDLGTWLRLEWIYPSVQDLTTYDMEMPLLLRSSKNMKLRIYLAKNEILHDGVFPLPNYDKNPYVVADKPASSECGREAIVALEAYSYEEDAFDEFIL